MPTVHAHKSRNAGEISDDSLDPFIALLIWHREISAEFLAAVTKVHTVLAQAVRARRDCFKSGGIGRSELIALAFQALHLVDGLCSRALLGGRLGHLNGSAI